MRETSDILTAKQRDVLLDVFARFADRIERVDFYGSRARGTHRPGSDIDLILAGNLDLEDTLRIAVALDESDLSIFADIARYAERMTPAFAAEVARDACVLFSGEELRAAKAAGLGMVRERHWNTY